MTCYSVSQNIWNISTHQSKVNRSNFFCNCVKVYTIRVVIRKNCKKSFLSVSTLCLCRNTGKKLEKKSEGSYGWNSHTIPSIFTIRIPPQQKYMTRVRTAKGSLYFELLGASFFLIELLCFNTSACLYMIRLGKCRISIIQSCIQEALRCTLLLIFLALS